MRGHGSSGDADPAPSRARLRVALAALCLVLVGVVLVAQLVVLGSTSGTGDAAGRGMEQGLTALLAATGLPLELGLPGLAAGLLIPARRVRSVAWIAGLGALGAWLGAALLVGALEAWATSQGQHGFDYGGVTQALWVLWLVGFGGFGLALGASRHSWRSPLAVLALLPVAVVMPVVFLLTSS